MRYSLPLVCCLILGCAEGTKPNPLVRGQSASREVVTTPVVPKPAPTPSSTLVPGNKTPPTTPPTVTAEPSSLYARLGGEIGIARVVDEFVKAMGSDPRIKEEHRKHFNEGDVAALKKKLVDQIGEATGGPQKYTGKTMKDAHQGLQITNADFDVTVEDLIKALNASKVAPKDQEELLTMLAKMRGDVVEKKD